MFLASCVSPVLLAWPLTCPVGLALCLTLLILSIASESMRYRLKFLAFMLMVLGAATLPIPLMLIRGRNWKNGLIPTFLMKHAGRLLGLNYEIRGRENIPKDGGCVVMINHQSILDTCVLSELWPLIRKCVAVSKREVLLFGTFGVAAWLWGTIFIDRSKSVEAQQTLNETMLAVKNNKARLLLFPEGKRNSGASLMNFKKGGFHVAIDAQVPILPVVVSRYYFVNHKTKRFDSGMSYITILPAIDTQGVTKEQLPQLLDRTRETMNSKFVESTHQRLTEHVESLKGE